jgi:hypothetical protein
VTLIEHERTTPGPPPAEQSLLTPLAEVLQTVNRLRVDFGLDPIYELPQATTAWDGSSGCVLEKAFEDMGVAYVDYRYAYGRQLRIEHGLGDFVRDFDAGRYPDLIASR